MLFATTLIAFACKNGARDNVEKTDSARPAHIDTVVAQPQTITADEATSSFLVKAADNGMTEVQLGGMAREKAIDQKVKNFGAMMVRDHGSMMDEIRELAARRNVKLPDSISDANRTKIDRLSIIPRKDFDKAYIDILAKDHQSAIDLYEKSGDNIHDTEVKNFINNNLPAMKTHLDSLRLVRKEIK